MFWNLHLDNVVSGLVNCGMHPFPWTLLLMLLIVHVLAENNDDLFCRIFFFFFFYPCKYHFSSLSLSFKFDMIQRDLCH